MCQTDIKLASTMRSFPFLDTKMFQGYVYFYYNIIYSSKGKYKSRITMYKGHLTKQRAEFFIGEKYSTKYWVLPIREITNCWAVVILHSALGISPYFYRNWKFSIFYLLHSPHFLLMYIPCVHSPTDYTNSIK